MDTLAPFKSRSEALRLLSALKDKKIAATIINTPTRQGLDCGLSVVFSSNYIMQVRSIIDKLKLKTFISFYNK